ncbi:DUF2397 family protein [Streptomonospora alba]|uniref:DUF2397 family protein n=1 Tax=Streptomonospora alba TaxID=183763 RepID=UPI000A636D46|nr:DUF2397 family protein [Streptomonospora alba]
MPRHGRAALLRLAAWFEGADPRSAHEICSAAFAVHGATHLGGPSEEPAGATSSWWNAPLAGGAAARLANALPAAPVRDHTEQRSRLRDAAESSAHWRRSAAQELRRVLAEATGGDSRIRLSTPAMEVLMELLTAALGSGDATRHPVSAGDLELGIRLHIRHDPRAAITLRGSDGDLGLEGLRLRVTSFDTPGETAAAPATESRDRPTPPSGTVLPFAREA